MKQRPGRQILIFALLCYLTVLSLDGVIFLLIHIPPKPVNLDRLLFWLGGVQHFFVLPRVFLRRLWPGELAPAGFTLVLTVVNYLFWGLAFAGLRNAWANVRK